MVATVLKSKMQRVDDGSFRLGGEEFACLFSARDVTGACKQADEIRTTLEQLEIEHLGNETGDKLELVVVVCVIIGL